MRTYRLRLSDAGITPARYDELRAYCRQYREKKAHAAALLGIRGCDKITTARDSSGREVGVTMPRTLRISTPTADAAIKRVMLLADCDLIDRVAASVGDGQWAEALKLHCCYEFPHAVIDQTLLPTANRNAFYRAKREFFIRLHEERIRREFDTPGAMQS